MQKDTSPLLELSTTLSLRRGEQTWGTERRMALLAAIGDQGSISAAARKVGLSYKAAWDAVDMMNNLSGDLLVERTTGGRHGGGARLTARARELVDWYQAVRAEHQRFMEVLARFGPHGIQHLDLLHNMALQTSARNRFEGLVASIESGRINDRVFLRLSGGLVLVATVTHASTERLALAPGRRALAFVKAQAVGLHAGESEEMRGEAGLNVWAGRIGHRAEGGGLVELSLDVAANVRITGFADPGSSREALAPGAMARARFRPADVLIGTMD
ncbi:Molybdate transport system regulatory protein OS=Castellaniella defragrans OX=75697 GN=HNR28_001315 PE=3 SV=1 [Castellaniella defragrans]